MKWIVRYIRFLLLCVLTTSFLVFHLDKQIKRIDLRRNGVWLEKNEYTIQMRNSPLQLIEVGQDIDNSGYWDFWRIIVPQGNTSLHEFNLFDTTGDVLPDYYTFTCHFHNHYFYYAQYAKETSTEGWVFARDVQGFVIGCADGGDQSFYADFGLDGNIDLIMDAEDNPCRKAQIYMDESWHNAIPFDHDYSCFVLHDESGTAYEVCWNFDAGCWQKT